MPRGDRRRGGDAKPGATGMEGGGVVEQAPRVAGLASPSIFSPIAPVAGRQLRMTIDDDAKAAAHTLQTPAPAAPTTSASAGSSATTEAMPASSVDAAGHDGSSSSSSAAVAPAAVVDPVAVAQAAIGILPSYDLSGDMAALVAVETKHAQLLDLLTASNAWKETAAAEAARSEGGWCLLLIAAVVPPPSTTIAPCTRP